MIHFLFCRPVGSAASESRGELPPDDTAEKISTHKRVGPPKPSIEGDSLTLENLKGNTSSL